MNKVHPLIDKGYELLQPLSRYNCNQAYLDLCNDLRTTHSGPEERSIPQVIEMDESPERSEDTNDYIRGTYLVDKDGTYISVYTYEGNGEWYEHQLKYNYRISDLTKSNISHVEL